MNILMDIVHPAHVHLLKNTYKQLTAKGHKVFVTVKNIPVAKQLLEIYKIPYINLGEKRDSIWSKVILQFVYNLKLWWIVVFDHISIGFGSSLTLAHISRVTGMKSIILDDDDDEVEPLFVKYAHPYANTVLSPRCTNRKTSRKISYNGLHELAYLHPNWFEPDPEVLKEAGLQPGEAYFIMRFNAFKAHHDNGVQGLSLENKRKLISLLEQKGKVFITTERNIDDEFKKYQLILSPEKIHSLLFYATMLIGDSQTMTSEAAVLGTPSIRCNTFVGRISYLEEEEHKYGLTYGFLPNQSEIMFTKIEELLSTKDLKSKWQEKRNILLKDKIDVTAFYVWFLENYPESINVMKVNSEI